MNTAEWSCPCGSRPSALSASMEPPCEHGGVTETARALTIAFELQWSRRVNTAECERVADRNELGPDASMEPPCEHGGVDVFPAA